RTAGRVPTVDHPGTVERLEELIPARVAAGLAGIACFYAGHAPSWTAHCLALARAHALVPTGGSDFHGRSEHGADLGAVVVPPETIELLEARRARSQGLP